MRIRIQAQTWVQTKLLAWVLISALRLALAHQRNRDLDSQILCLVLRARACSTQFLIVQAGCLLPLGLRAPCSPKNVLLAVLESLCSQQICVRGRKPGLLTIRWSQSGIRVAWYRGGEGIALIKRITHLSAEITNLSAECLLRRTQRQIRPRVQLQSAL